MARSKVLKQRLARLSAQKRVLFEKRLRGKASKGIAAAIPRRLRGLAPPVSLAQERLWRFARRHPASVLHNLHHAIALEGTLDVGALWRAVREVVRRHEALRTRFPASSASLETEVAASVAFPFKLVGLKVVPAARQRDEMMRRVEVEARRPFHLARGPLLRILVFALSSKRHTLVFFVHHLVIDGWSLGVLLREVAALYGALACGATSPLAELPIQYGDFAAWQREDLHATHQRDLAFWKEYLAGCPRRSTFPARKPRATAGGRAGMGYQVSLPADLAAALEESARQHRSTLFMVLLAAWSVLLHRHSGQLDLVLGAPTAGRPHAMLQDLIGFFVNLLVLRIDLAGDPTFSDLMARVRETTLAAYNHQDLPFENLLTTLGETSGDSLAPPLVQVTLNLATVGAGGDPAIEAAGVVFEPLFTHDLGSEFDLSLYAVPGAEGLRLHFAYNPDLFTREWVESLAEEFHKLLVGVTAAPQHRLSEYVH